MKDILIRPDPKLKVRIAGFADKLKETTHLLYKWAGVQSKQYYDDNPADRNKPILALGNKTVVDLWIEFGNHCREYQNDIWINPIFRDNNCDVLLLSDLRFPNEYECVKQFGGTVIKIHNPRIPYRDSPADNAMENFIDWDDVFINDKNLSDLYKYCQSVKERFL